MANIKYPRILLKLSGEALAGDKKVGLFPDTLQSVAKQIAKVHSLGTEVGIVIGGGNFIRGISAGSIGIERVAADHMGMLATVINSLAMQACLENCGVEARVMSAIPIPSVAESYVKRQAVSHLAQKRIVLFAAGTGNPFFSTDSAAALRAIETQCDIIMKATKVDGIFSGDPIKNKDAEMYDFLNYTQVINNELAVMDTASIALCRENNMPILVFNMNQPANLEKAVKGEKLGTLVTAEAN
jgi:uridylate kinase